MDAPPLRPARLLAPLTLLLAAACGAADIRQQAEESLDPGRVVALQPADGAMALRGDIEVEVALGRHAVGVVPEVWASGGGDHWEPACELDETGHWASCRPIRDPGYDTEFEIEVTVGRDEPVVVHATSEAPREGRAYLLTEGSIVERFGSDRSTAERATGLFQGFEMVGVLVGWPGEGRMETDFVAGPAAVDEDGVASVEPPGLTMVAPVVVEADGGFHGETPGLLMPVEVEGELVPVLVEEATIGGRVGEHGLDEFRIEGVVGAGSLVRLAEPLGALGDLLLDGVELDEDTDGDGEPDAASFGLVSSPPEVDLSAWVR